MNYNGCTVEISFACSSRAWADRASAKLRQDYPGIGVALNESPSCDGVQAASAFVPNDHPQARAGRLDTEGNMIEPWGERLLLMAAEAAIGETADAAES
jgi:hypothetical protein